MNRASFKRIETRIAKFLNRFEQIKNVLRIVRHLIFKKRYKYRLNHEISLSSIPSQNEETFFGYYTNLYANCENKILFHSKEAGEEFVKLNLLDLSSDQKTTFDQSLAWNWQQGSMLQWLDPKENLIAYNIYDPEEDLYKGRIYDSKENQILQDLRMPLYTYSSKNKLFFGLSFERLSIFRPDYGYFAHSERKLNSMGTDGIWICKIDTEPELIISLEDIVNSNPINTKKCWVNHIQVNSEGDKFLFIFRWKTTDTIYKSRLMMYHLIDKKLTFLFESSDISHYDWISDQQIIIWATLNGVSSYKLINVTTLEINSIAENELPSDGHPSLFDSKNQWILTDTYPNKSRMSKLILYNLGSDRKLEIGEFYQSLKFNGPNRCDLHPRPGFTKGTISFDSTHSGKREMYLADLNKIL